MIRNVIFDFGQVMIRFDGDIMTAPYVAEEDRAAVRDVVFDRKYFDALDVGAMTDEEAKADYRRRLPERLWESADLVYDNWICNLPPIEGMAELVRDLKKAGYSVYLLSNISRYFSSHKEANPVLFEFRDWVFSAEVGLVKPDPAIFRLAVEKFGVDPHETLFVDDNAQNLEGARAVGLSTYLFDGNANRLRAALLGMRGRARLQGGFLKEAYDKVRENFYRRIDPAVHATVYSGIHDVTYAEPEFTGKYLDLCARAFEEDGNPEILSRARRVAENIVENQREDGHITSYERGKETEWFSFWNQSFTVYGLLRMYEVTGDEFYLTPARRATDFMIDFFTRDGAPSLLDAINQGSQHISAFYSVAKLAALTGEKKYLDFLTWALDTLEGTDMNLLSFRDILALRSKKGIEMLVVYLGVLLYGELTGDTRATDAARRYWREVTDTQIRNTGNGTVVEFWTEGGNRDRFMPTEEKPNETCVAVGYTELSLALFFKDGGAEYLDAIEKTLYNHMAGSISPDGRDFAYYQGNFGKKIFRKAEGLYQCCRYRGYTLFSYLPTFLVRDTGDTVTPILYTPFSYEAEDFSLTLQTEYPKNGEVRLSLKGAPRTLLLRVPGTAAGARLRVCGKESSLPVEEGYFRIPFAGGESTVELSLDLPVVPHPTEIDGKEYVYFTKGPLLLAEDTHFGGDLSLPLPDAAPVALVPEKTLALVKVGDRTLIDFASAGTFGEDDTYTVYLPRA